MPEPESTPELWRVDKDYHGWAIRDANGWLIALTPKKTSADRMAAAPEMLELLEWASSQLCEYPTWCEANHPVRKPKHDAIRAAIAKAKGRNRGPDMVEYTPGALGIHTATTQLPCLGTVD